MADRNPILEEAIDALQAVSLTARRLRRDLGDSAQRAVELEAASDRAVQALKRLQPRERDEQ